MHFEYKSGWLALLLAAAPLASFAATPESAPPAVAPADDPDGDGLSGAEDPEPYLSNREERFAYRLESPTLTWELNMEQLTQIESSVEQAEQEVTLLREAAQGVLDESARTENVRLTQTTEDNDGGALRLSVNPLKFFDGLVGGLGAIDALASGIRLGGGLETRDKREEKNDFLVLNRLTREQGRSKTDQAERRSRLLRLQRFTKVLRNPRLQVSLHVRNGADSPLIIERPEVPVLTGDRALGVALPQDARDRERVVIPPRRSQVILLQVPVADSDFWDALTQGAEAIRYVPELGAMRARFENRPGLDLLAIRRRESETCLPVRLLLPEGVVMERALARTDDAGRPVTVRTALAQWNAAWSRSHPESRGDLFHVDEAGLLVSAAGRTGSVAGAAWQVEVDDRPVPLGEALDMPVTQGVRIRWGESRAGAAELAAAAVRGAKSPWLQTGLAVAEDMRRLRAGGDAKAVASALESRLSGAAPEASAQVLSALGEARRLAGDIAGARDTWRRAVKGGDAGALLGLAQLALDAPNRGAEALALMRGAASAGHPEALARLADMESRLPGAPADIAPQLLGQSAEAGYAPALTLLGQRYENGEGLPRDTRRAAALYREAATRGDVAAMLRLGILHETGQGVPRDAVRAAAWYRAAATGVPVADSDSSTL